MYAARSARIKDRSGLDRMEALPRDLSEDPTVAHVLVRAVFALLRTQSCEEKGVHTRVNAARKVPAPRGGFITFDGPPGT